jgi:Cu/Ag efflux protein CusF
MKIYQASLVTVLVALSTTTLAIAAEPQQALPAETVVSSTEVTATVTKIDQATREVTLKPDDGEEFTFVASDAVKNLGQVKAGDRVRVTYAEALAYEVKKGGQAASPSTVVAGKSADLGATPEGAIARQTTATVAIVAIDPKVPSVTFKGPAGNTQTIKVRHPEKLQGVQVGDTVEITYTEALAIKLEPAPKK